MIKRFKKPVLIVLSMILMVLSVSMLFGCAQKASKYTEEEHMQRISERIRKKYIDGDRKIRGYDPETGEEAMIDATGFEVYPLYNENDELKYCLVEFQPYGHLYVLIKDESLAVFSFPSGSTSMYRLSSINGQPGWTPYTVNEDTGEIVSETISGETIKYYNSPFFVRGMQKEKKYLITYQGQKGSSLKLFAVKKDEKYLHLVSGQEFEMIDGEPVLKYDLSDYVNFYASRELDL